MVTGFAMLRAPLFAMLCFAGMVAAFDGRVVSLIWGSLIAFGLSGIWTSAFNERWLKWAEARARDPAAFAALAMRWRLPHRRAGPPAEVAI